ncbi:MAG TPA: Crp/Fnr family transcriptional regulator [Thermoanaerobacterales bacterium]|nr:Crp/Fnr family transcriptional regulator [Thermoanaerobacterales bacterium]
MKELAKALNKCTLLRDIPEEQILEILKSINYQIGQYSKEQTVAFEDEECAKMGIILKGSAEIRKTFACGKTVTIDRLHEGDIFGEVIIFSDMTRYPSTIVSTGKTEIMFINKDDIIKIASSNQQVLKGFMRLLSNKILVLNNKIRNLSYQTIRQKIANYIIEEVKKQKSLIIHLPFLRREIAEQLGIPRPSLSRELIRMRKEGLIDFGRNQITVKDINLLEECLFN